MLYRDAALLMLGHGSTLNADSSAPTYQHAEEIRRRGIFAEVHVGFWKEEPNFRQALRQAQSKRVYVVPNFISEGYFTEQVIPRELGLTGPVTEVEGKEVFYCKPVGLSPAMTGALLRKAEEVVTASGEAADLKKTCLFICGHGTSLNDNSTRIIHEQAEIIRAREIYGDCQGVLMEQRPFVKDWRTMTDCLDVIVVPFFISDGLHSYEDIPVLLGLTHNIKEKGFTNPHREGTRRLWYATAIGTEGSIADVILELVEAFDVEHSVGTQTKEITTNPVAENLQKIPGAPGPWRIGQVSIKLRDDGGFEVAHMDNSQDQKTSYPGADFDTLRTLILRNEEGDFRPLRASPDLQRHWLIPTTDARELQLVLDYIYPAEIANWALWQSNELAVIPWQETAERQTGRFRVVRELDDAGVKEVVAEVCERGCLKRRLWRPVEQAVNPATNEIPLLCPEACNYFVSKAREKLKGPGEE